MKKFSVICCLVLLLLLVGGQVSALVTVVAEEIVEEPIGNYEEELNEKLEEDTKEIEEDIVTEEITVEPEEKPVEQVPMKEMRDVFDEVNANGVAEEKSKLTVENALISSYTKEKLGYQAGSVVSWSVPASLSHYGDDMMGSASHLKYSGTTKIEKKYLLFRQTERYDLILIRYQRRLV
ncbi:exported hypothetical protein [Carnobacterium maltaromaticum]|uniref:hypothetical protein n=1 Tax=Carnobacterium maltaromaticum TaxID=2751 RepID=UPI00191BB7A7|nr:hypothetical protein [Carnobacterium maltaromaticum]CAD5896745.1 exported hypothetical protein [Carnobacterium maltaromaticum]